MSQPFDKPISVGRPLFPSLNKYKKRLKEVWNSKWLTNIGDQHKKLEKKLKEYLKVNNLSLLNNGTTALQVALKVLDLKGEVITTPFTFAATPHAISWMGLKPIFCDINSKTLNIDVNKIEELITEQTSAILPVHVFGTPCKVDKIQDLANRYDLKVIYDAAHAFGSEINGNGIGNYGDVSMFSFHATKLFNTAEGGALTCNNTKLNEKINMMREFGMKNKENILMTGTNGKMNELQASLGLEVLKCVDEERKKRKNIKDTYKNNLEEVRGIKLLKKKNNVRDSFQYFVIRVLEKEFGCSRDTLYSKLKDYNIYTRKYFYPLCSNFECYKFNLSSNSEKLPVANKISKEVLALPFYGDLTKDDIVNICNVIKEIKFNSKK